jgi:hypothetical protein
MDSAVIRDAMVRQLTVRDKYFVISWPRFGSARLDIGEVFSKFGSAHGSPLQ